MVIHSVHHVGIVMNDLNRALAFMKTFNLQEDYREYVPRYQALCIFTKMETGTAIEFIVPDGGVLYNYNNGKGGIHHIAFLVDNIDKTTAEYEKMDLGMLEETGVKGAGSIYVNFMRPRYGQGILVEFVEERKENKRK